MKKTILFIVLLFVSEIIAAQCAMCKAVVESGNISMAEGINDGITYLMIFPYILVGILSYTLYRYKKRIKD